MSDTAPTGYRWGIRIHYRHGRSQAWPCDDEAAARAEYAYWLAEYDADGNPDVSEIRLERRPIPPWEPVETRSFGGEGQGHGR